ncbi:hypothetical protein TNCV_3918301 [Trichonephila clavipes]|nr:hypothetical protein TNCV_3918301 [Trichonephila clavipes]
MANWSHCEEFPKIKQKKGESTLNRNTVKRTEANKTLKPVTTDLPFTAALKDAQNENKKPGTSAPTEETPQINENNSNEISFGIQRCDYRTKKIFPRLPFPLGNGQTVQKCKRRRDD